LGEKSYFPSVNTLKALREKSYLTLFGKIIKNNKEKNEKEKER